MTATNEQNVSREGGRDSPAWWQRGGEECCGFCHGAFAYAVEYRCVACDQAVCPTCVRVMRVRTVVFCPDCAH